jgi:UDP-N-acetylmuramyl pentapeptide phosphotransferase/UDP-N-acetylglucosamine-1-phosphate transferase
MPAQDRILSAESPTGRSVREQSSRPITELSEERKFGATKGRYLRIIVDNSDLPVAVSLAGFAAVVCYLLCFLLYRALLRANVVDRPTARSSHTSVTVRGGGIAIVVVWCGLMVCYNASHVGLWLMAVASLAVISFIDDWRSLPILLRLSCQIAVALVGVGDLCRPLLSNVPLIGPHNELMGLAASALAVLWLVGYTNAFNFMDGINGISVGQTMTAGLGMGLLAGVTTGLWDAKPVVCSFILAGSALGFLPHNFPKARMFMGDVGSATIGFILATLVLWLVQDCGWGMLVPLVLLHTNYILDTGITLVRRMIAKARWYEPHREHFYQRLVRAGKSHSIVTLTEMALQVVVFFLLLIYSDGGWLVKGMITAGVLAIWTAYFIWAERCFQKAARQALPPTPITG